MDHVEFSRERSGNPADPCRKMVWQRWKHENWESLRAAHRATSSSNPDVVTDVSGNIQELSNKIQKEHIIAAMTEELPHYSDNLPQRITKYYQATLSDPDVLSLQREVALFNARLADLVKHLDSGESGWMWQSLKRTLDEMLSAKSANDDARAMGAFNQMVRLIRAGHADAVAWQESVELVMKKKLLVESERRRYLDLQLIQKQMMGEMEVYAVDLLQAITDEVQDPEIVERIKNRYLRIRQSRTTATEVA